MDGRGIQRGPGSCGCWMLTCQILVRTLILACSVFNACSCSNHTQDVLHRACYDMDETEKEAFKNKAKCMMQARELVQQHGSLAKRPPWSILVAPLAA